MAIRIGSSLDPPREVGEGLERRAVGPLGVVDDERERPRSRPAPSRARRGCARARRLVAGGRRSPCSSRHGVGGRRPPPCARARARMRAQRRLQQRADHAVGEVALERPGRRAAESKSAAPARPLGVVEQRGLAEPGARPRARSSRRARTSTLGDGVGRARRARPCARTAAGRRRRGSVARLAAAAACACVLKHGEAPFDLDSALLGERTGRSSDRTRRYVVAATAVTRS